ncbi:alcohol oxidase-like protein [Pestalotiopsis sp. NC0098]|nr:alcohol oxidase-like protein [Pestalotiopsis sp. NC0098]
MPLYTELPLDIDTVDVIIAGGGTSGCIVASRLSDADASLSILLIEAGSNNHGDPTVTTPFLFVSHLASGSKTVTVLKGNKSEFLGDREPVVQTARMLGGGSSVNMLMYSRAQRSDFDAWQTPGWSSEDLLPYMRKTETYHGDDPKNVHGTDGPIHISHGTFTSTCSQDAFIDAAKSKGWKEASDLGDLATANGVQRAKRYISPDGIRQDVAHKYLHPRLEDGAHLNLHVLVQAHVDRVIFDGKKASGVTYKSSGTSGGETRSVKARKLVILSSGACGTPPILERSGVGDTTILERAGIDPIVNLPGVGAGYQDHHTMGYIYRSDLAADETLDGIMTGTFDIPAMMQSGDKMLGWNCLDVTGKLRPSPKDVAALGPGFQRVWDRDFKNHPDRPLSLLCLINGGMEPVGEPGQYFSITAFTAYPYSRGHIHITGPDPEDPIDFTPGIFSDPEGADVLACRWNYKAQREIARRMRVYRGEVAGQHPPFAADSAAKPTQSSGPPPSDVSDIEYSAEDDAVIDSWVRGRVSTPWHSLGTCKMAPREQDGVVDETLSVYGVEGLKVADLSIPPKNVAAHTNATALLIGEKAADIFIRELGL